MTFSSENTADSDKHTSGLLKSEEAASWRRTVAFVSILSSVLDKVGVM